MSMLVRYAEKAQFVTTHWARYRRTVSSWDAAHSNEQYYALGAMPAYRHPITQQL